MVWWSRRPERCAKAAELDPHMQRLIVHFKYRTGCLKLVYIVAAVGRSDDSSRCCWRRGCARCALVLAARARVRYCSPFARARACPALARPRVAAVVAQHAAHAAVAVLHCVLQLVHCGSCWLRVRAPLPYACSSVRTPCSGTASCCCCCRAACCSCFQLLCCTVCCS